MRIIFECVALFHFVPTILCVGGGGRGLTYRNLQVAFDLDWERGSSTQIPVLFGCTNAGS